MRVAEESLNEANKLYSPVLDNLNKLIETARAAEVMRNMQKHAQLELADQAHDHKCDNPDCKNQTNH